MNSSSSSSIEHQVPKGGPIYLSDLIGPITRVPDFESSVLQELENLITQVNLDSYEDEDVSVDDLKVLSEEELVEKALKEVEKIESLNKNGHASSSDEAAANDVIVVKKDRKSRKGMKRGRTFDRDTRANELEDASYIEKVEELARIKQKQDDDKIAARLHSFNGGCKVIPAQSDNKMKSLRFITSNAKVRKTVTEHVPIPYPEIVLCVEVYNMKKSWMKKTMEMLVLGSQMLSELRDEIYCLTDQLMQKAGKHDPSGYFLIEDVFCNDKRDQSAIDYSEPIFEWLRKSKDEATKKWECILSGELQQKQKGLFGSATGDTHLPHFKTVEMHKIRFCDLWFRLGAGYLYCHQGDCKHMIVIRDMRLLHPEDVQNRAAYPIVTFQLKIRHHKCSVCKIYRATKVTVDDKWAQENPCYFCDNCYYLLHYQEDGSLLYPDFTVFDYHHE